MTRTETKLLKKRAMWWSFSLCKGWNPTRESIESKLLLAYNSEGCNNIYPKVRVVSKVLPRDLSVGNLSPLNIKIEPFGREVCTHTGTFFTHNPLNESS